MSIRTSSSPELPRVQALPKAASTAGGWQSIPHISQLRPSGSDASYVNAAYNCAPAVVAMLACGAGKQSELSDAQLINQLGQGLVTANGTTPQGLAVMLGRAGVPIEGKALAGEYSDDAVKKHLQQGHKLIAQVALTDADQKNASAHYVLIRDVNSQGNYVISDPMSSEVAVVTPEQLRNAVNRAPPDGGLLVPVGGPSSSTKTSSTLKIAWARSKPGLDDFKPSSSSQKPGSSPTTPVAAPSQGSMPPAPTLNAGTLGTVSNPGGAFNAPPSATAFSVSDTAFEGIDTSFQQGTGSARPRLPSLTTLHNMAALDIDYGAQGANPSLLTAIMPVTGRDRPVAEIVQDLRQRKQNNDPTVDKFLERLENSIALQDKLVLKLFKEAELKDPGIGKKTWTDPM
jgi:hypothetical protein